MEQSGYLKIDRNGRSLIIGESLKRSLCHQAGYYSLAQQTQESIGFKRVSSIPKHNELREPIVFQGDIGGVGSTIEVINFVISARLKGQLTLVQRDVRKSLFFEGGELCAARSNHLDDRLSAILYRYGALEREKIEAAEEAAERQKTPLGNYLISRGELTQGQLYLYFRKQVEEIFFSTLLWSRGEFYFTTPHLKRAPTPLKLNAQQLLLEGVKRADEMSQCREVIPSDLSILVAQEELDSVKLERLSEEQQALYSYLESPRSMRELIEYFRVGELPLYQRLSRMVTGGVVKVDGERSTYQDRLSIDEVVMLFNRSFAMIAEYARLRQLPHSLVEGLELFSKFSHSASLFEGVSFDERGYLEPNALMHRLGYLGLEESALGEGLCELLFLQMFVARSWLAPEEYQELREIYDEISQLVEA